MSSSLENEAKAHHTSSAASSDATLNDQHHNNTSFIENKIEKEEIIVDETEYFEIEQN